MDKKVILSVLFLFFSLSIAATEYHVRTDGNNDNAGTSDSPEGAWLTIDYAADNVSAGDVVIVHAGTYPALVTPSVSGTEGNLITFIADGEVITCGWDFASALSYVRVIGFKIDCDIGDCSNLDNGFATSGLSTFLEFWNNTIQDCDKYDGIRVGNGSITNQCSNCIYFGNLIQNCLSDGSSVGIRHAGDNTLIAYNEITNIAPDGMFVLGSDNILINNYIHGLTEELGGHADFFQAGSSIWKGGFERNLFDANIGFGSEQGDEHVAQISNTGADGDPFDEALWRKNVFYTMGSYGVGHGSDQAIYGITNFRFYNNTFVDLSRGYANATYNTGIALFGNSGVDDTFVYNTLFYEGWGSAATSNITGFNVGSGDIFADYNLAFDPDGEVTFTAAWNNQAHEQSNLDPGFTSYAGNDYTITNSGAAYNNGGPLTYVNSESGTGTSFAVDANTANFFKADNTSISQYGGNLIVGDVITVGTDVLRIASISGDVITVTESFTWEDNDPVYFGTDTTPDIGAYPYKAGGYTLSATYTMAAGTVTVTPNDASLVRMVVVYEDGIPVGVDSITPYEISGIGAGTLDVRVYPLYASSTLYASAGYAGTNNRSSSSKATSGGSISKATSGGAKIRY